MPPRRITNADFEKIVDTSDEWIVTRTGIHERRISDEDTHSSDMATAAAKSALEMAGLAPEDIDMLVVGTVTPDYRLPSCACVTQEKLGLTNAVAFDIVAACTGFISGLNVASSFIESGKYKNILVIGVEKLSSITNWNDRGTCVLFGDGGGAAVLTADESDSGVLSTFLKSDGRYGRLLWQEVGGSVNPYTPDFNYDGRDKIYMNGSEVFKVAVKEMANSAVAAVEQAGLKSEDISLVVPHQANIRIIEALIKRLKLSMDNVYLNIEKYGNTSAASVPIALDEANREGRIKPNDHVLMVAFGGGLIWGSALVRW